MTFRLEPKTLTRMRVARVATGKTQTAMVIARSLDDHTGRAQDSKLAS
jgi:hypothetical protein